MQTIGSSACGALRRSAIDFAESRLEIRHPTSAGAELPDQGSVFCERWCARRCRGETVPFVYALMAATEELSAPDDPEKMCWTPRPSTGCRRCGRLVPARY